MTPNYLNSPPPPPFPLQLNEDQHHQLLFSPKPQPSSSSSSSLTCPIFFSPTKEQGGCHYRDLHQAQPQQEVVVLVLHNLNLAFLGFLFFYFIFF